MSYIRDLILFSPSTTDDLLFPCSSPANLQQICSGTPRCVKLRAVAFLHTANGLSRLRIKLKYFFTEEDIPLFRYWQSRTRMLISGSTALQFLDRSFFRQRPNSRCRYSKEKPKEVVGKLCYDRFNRIRSAFFATK